MTDHEHLTAARKALTEAFAAINVMPHGRHGPFQAARLAKAQTHLAEARRLLDFWEREEVRAGRLEEEDWAQGMHASCCGEPGSGPCCQSGAEAAHHQ